MHSIFRSVIIHKSREQYLFHNTVLEQIFINISSHVLNGTRRGRKPTTITVNFYQWSIRNRGGGGGGEYGRDERGMKKEGVKGGVNGVLIRGE